MTNEEKQEGIGGLKSIISYLENLIEDIENDELEVKEFDEDTLREDIYNYIGGQRVD